MSEGTQTKVSKSEFARHRGVSPAMVTKWAKAGRLMIEGKAVLLEASDAALASSLHPLQGGRRGGGSGRGSGNAASPSAGSGLIRSKERQTDFAADLLELRLRKERGELVEKDRYDAALRDGLAPALAKLESISSRIAPALAAETQVRRIQDLIDDEIASVRQAIADTINAMIAAASATKQ